MNVSELTYHGTPCRKAGHTLRYRNGQMCVECNAQKNAQRYAQTRPARVAAVRQFRQDNPESIRRTHLKRYGLTPEQYQLLLDQQGGACAICGATHAQSAVTEKWLFIDHDHTTGAVRGLLCNHCNRGLGAFKDSPDTLTKAIEYLRTRF